MLLIFRENDTNHSPSHFTLFLSFFSLSILLCLRSLVLVRCNRDPVEWMLERDYKVPTVGKNATPSTREDLDRPVFYPLAPHPKTQMF